MSTYYAKSSSFSGGPISVAEHCEAVGAVAKTYGTPLGMGEAAHLVGLLHDFGKYSDLFQDVLAGRESRVDHAIAGAALVAKNYKTAPSAVIEAIAGHHSGLLSDAEIRPYIEAIYNRTDGTAAPSGKRPSLLGRTEFQTAVGHMAKELALPLPVPEQLPLTGAGWKGKLQRMMTTRMLFSCQVDADYSVSAAETDGDDSRLDENALCDVRQCLDWLEAHRNRIKLGVQAATNITALRETVYSDCSAAGQNTACNFWTLTAPTGAGKTFGMLKFALERCLADSSKKRIILVLPFLSLVDQVAETAKEIIPGITIDTSQAAGSDENRMQSKNWNAPCVITTSVQFFDSLFSDQPGSCRKLHNMANAVVAFDEIQALPSDVSRLAIQSLHWLARDYNSCIMLSTATQPAYGILPEIDWEAQEVVRDIKKCFSLAVPKTYEFVGQVELEQIAMAAAEFDNACVICNLKRHALQVYQALADSRSDGVYLLSTDLCPAHRLEVISEIKQRQKNGLPVLVAATQCIEAGVDLDFVKVFRALAPLTSIIQAAGRQNRSGNHKNMPVTVFEPVRTPEHKHLYPGADYERQAVIVKTMQMTGFDFSNIDSIYAYYQRLFKGFDEPEPLKNALAGVNYPEMANRARLIASTGCQVIVPYEGRLSTYQEILAAVHSGHIGKNHLVAAGGITVQSYNIGAVQTHCQELTIRKGQEEHGTGVYILLEGHESCYDSTVGLHLEDLTGGLFC